MISVLALIAGSFAIQAESAEIRQPSLALETVASWKAEGLKTESELEHLRPVGSAVPLNCGTLETPMGSGVKRYSLFSGDLNNDGVDDITVVQRCVGAAKRDVLVGFAEKTSQGWRWMSFKKLLEQSGDRPASLPAQIDPMDFPRELSSGTWVIPFQSESWILQNGQLQVNRSGTTGRSE